MHRALARALPLSLVLLALPATASQQPVQPTPAQPLVSNLVGGSLSSLHYAARPLDDQLAEAWLDNYLQALDPAHTYFLAKDVTDFKARAHAMDDDVQRTQPKLDLAFEVFERYRRRAAEAFAAVDATLKAPMDFSDPKAAVDLDRAKDPWPETTAEWKTLWQRRVQAEVLDFQLSGETPEKAVELVTKRYKRRADNVDDLDASDVFEIYLTALAEVFDPHSAYFAPASSDDFDIQMRDALEGIGAELRMEEAYTKVVRLIPGGPAEAGGQLMPGDLIVAVAQGSDTPVDVVDMRLDHVVKLIRGPKGSNVRLTVRPADAPDSTRVVSIVRDRVVLERASAKGELRGVPGPDGQAMKLGVIEVPSFYVDSWAVRQGDTSARSTTNDVRKLIEQLRGEGAQAMVLDLRANGGGALSEAISLTGLFIDKGPVVQVRDPRRGVERLDDTDAGVAWAGPLTVVTDELSASASEIFAGAIQDYGRGLIVGAPQTHGKGTVQSMIDLGAVLEGGAYRDLAPEAGALKLTVQKFYRVSGGSTQNKGVVPDVVLPSPWQGLDVLESDLDNPLPWDTIGAARYTPMHLGVDLASLQAASSARVASQPVFGWLAEDIAERKAMESRETLSLHQQTREAERAARIAKLEARGKLLGIDLPDPDAAVEQDVDAPEDERKSLDDVLEDAILDEALAVTVEFASQWRPDPSLVNADLGPKSAEVPSGDARRKRGR